MTKRERLRQVIYNCHVEFIGDMTSDMFLDAFLAELREPDEGMKARASRLNHPRDEEIWRAMIDAVSEGKDDD